MTKALESIEQGLCETIVVTAADLAMIQAMLENPPAPNEKLAALLANYKEKVANGIIRTDASDPSAFNL